MDSSTVEVVLEEVPFVKHDGSELELQVSPASLSPSPINDKDTVEDGVDADHATLTLTEAEETAVGSPPGIEGAVSSSSDERNVEDCHHNQRTKEVDVEMAAEGGGDLSSRIQSLSIIEQPSEGK
jgi:hypothetical protein